MQPILVVGLPAKVGQPRYPMLIVVPLTTDRSAKWSEASPILYPKIPAGSGGIQKDSLALLDQIRAVDVSRVVGKAGSFSDAEMMPIINGLKHLINGHHHKQSL
ncbi:MAG: type II toxin-antitoxin system PemK/MazF family toxin [Candidatus Ozemobacteraceae bacterium]